MTPTTLMLFGKRYRLPSEKSAYLRTLEAFLTMTADLLTDPKSGPCICNGRDGAPLFAPTSDYMHQPARIAKGWYAETCLSNDQKVRILDTLAQYASLKRGTDWDWQAENRPTREFIDTAALLAKL